MSDLKSLAVIASLSAGLPRHHPDYIPSWMPQPTPYHKRRSSKSKKEKAKRKGKKKQRRRG